MFSIKKFSLYGSTVLMFLGAILLGIFLTCSSDESDDDDGGNPGDLCSVEDECNPSSTCYNGRCVTEGVLRFSLSWTVDTDFDLHVETPGYYEIYFGDPEGDGGTLDVDDCIGGECANQDGMHVENIYFTDSAPSGIYTYWVNNFDEEMSGSFTIEVFESETKVATQTGTLAASYVDSSYYTWTYSK